MMRRMGWLILLISVGLNLGLGFRLWEARDSEPREMRTERWSGRRGHSAHREGEQGLRERFPTDQGDTSAWRGIMSGRLDRMAERLDLTPEQVQTLHRSQEANFTRFVDQRVQLEAARDRLHGIIFQAEVDPDSVRTAIRLVGIQQARFDSLITEALLKEMDILEPAQRTGYLRLLPVMRDRGQGREHRSGRRSLNRPAGQPPESR
jgi:Spy/CpxP family protein refolding chaperone